MKHTTRTLMIGAALAGLLGGTAARAATTAHKKSGDHTSVKTTKHKKGEGEDKDKKDKKEGKDKHECAGKNECKGKGGCKTGDNGCKGKNSCAGKGGCAPHKHDADK